MKNQSAVGMWWMLWDKAGMAFVFVLMFVGLSIFVPNFFTWTNMVGLSLSVSTVGIVACTMLFCLASGDFDISVESTVAFAGVLAAVVINATGSVCAGVAAGTAAGALVGLVNGTVIAKLKINALITTLATMQIVRGLCFIVSGGSAVSVANENFFKLGRSVFPCVRVPSFLASQPFFNNAELICVPVPVWLTAACFVVFGLLLNRTTFGRNTLAIGGNKEAALLSGIAVSRTKIAIFTLQGAMAAFAGVILASRMTSGQPNTSQGFSLDVISACVLGGVSLAGGVGTITGTIVGVLIMGTVQNVMSLMNVETFYQYVARGIILLAAVLFDQLKKKA